jgi:hypothetical protein
MEENNTDNYIPGVCNIGKEERKRRRQTGVIGLIITVITYSLFLYFDVNKGVRFLVFIPAMLSAVGFIQSRMHFCVYFGLAEIFNFDKVGKTSKVGTEEFVRKDKKKARLIIYYSVLIGIAVGLLAVLL